MICPYCHKEAQWVPNEMIYGRRYGKSYMAYWCKPCNAYVGCHLNTRKPLGTMANRETREWRMKTHAVIDPLWKSGKYARKNVYKRLKKAFGEEVHIGAADIERCKAIIEIVPQIFHF